MRQDPAPGPRRPQVGDTLTVVHRVAAPPGALVQARAPEDTTLVTLIGPPDISREGDSVRIAYGIAVWSPGRHELVIPGAIVVSPAGYVDTLPDARLLIDVASVLPPGASVDTLQPQSARPWVARAEVSLLPVVVLLVPVLVMLAIAGWLWRRRGPSRPALPSPGIPSPNADRLRAWLEAGEAGLVIDHLHAALADRENATGWRDAVAVVRFDAVHRERLTELAREGLTLFEDASRS